MGKIWHEKSGGMDMTQTHYMYIQILNILKEQNLKLKKPER